MVRPGQLIRTGIKSLVSLVIGEQSDRRIVQALAARRQEYYDHSHPLPRRCARPAAADRPSATSCGSTSSATRVTAGTRRTRWPTRRRSRRCDRRPERARWTCRAATCWCSAATRSTRRRAARSTSGGSSSPYTAAFGDDTAGRAPARLRRARQPRLVRRAVGVHAPVLLRHRRPPFRRLVDAAAPQLLRPQAAARLVAGGQRRAAAERPRRAADGVLPRDRRAAHAAGRQGDPVPVDAGVGLRAEVPRTRPACSTRPISSTCARRSSPSRHRGAGVPDGRSASLPAARGDAGVGGRAAPVQKIIAGGGGAFLHPTHEEDVSLLRGAGGAPRTPAPARSR